MDQDKKKQRELKRVIKRAGNKKRRQHLKKVLRDNPEEAHMEDDYDFGEDTSTVLNNLDGKHKEEDQP